MQDFKPDSKKIAAYETADGVAYLVYLYRDKGLDDEQVAKEIGITRKTLYNWRKKSKTIENAVNIGKASVDQKVENALLQSALSGNVTAMIFWLKNRKPNKWRERQTQEVDINLPTFIDDIKEVD